MAAKIEVADATVDGTTDFKPLRSKQYDIRKQHISELPITLSNWYKHIDWLNVTFILLIPLAGFIYSYWVPLHFYTFIFAIVYYFNTGLGITAGEPLLSTSPGDDTEPRKLTESIRLPPPLGTHFVQGNAPVTNLSRCRWCRSR